MFPKKIKFYFLFLFSYLVGVLLYDYLWDFYNFSYTDEVIALWLLVIYLKYFIVTNKFNEEFFYFLFIALLYLIYSLTFGANCWQGILTDFCIQIKPFLCFYVVYAFNPIFPKWQIKSINILSIICFAVLLFIGMQGETFITNCFHHTSKYATAVTITGFLYLYSSNRDRYNILITLIIWSIGIFSFRSKFYGFYALAIVLLLFVDLRKYIKVRLWQKILYCVLLLAIVLFVAREKISHYLIDGTANEENMFARVALYYKVPQIVVDYFPFGPGLGSYASFASGEFYSPLYTKYNMEHLDGMTPDDYYFVADTYYPVLAQFGIVGVYLFGLFWVRRMKTVCWNKYSDDVLIKMNILVFVFFFIESITDSTFTNNRGLFMMMLFALFIRESESVNSRYY